MTPTAILDRVPARTLRRVVAALREPRGGPLIVGDDIPGRPDPAATVAEMVASDRAHYYAALRELSHCRWLGDWYEAIPKAIHPLRWPEAPESEDAIDDLDRARRNVRAT